MKLFNHISVYILAAGITVSLGIGIALRDILLLPPNVIHVIAGNDKTICLNQNLLISDLGANISGDVSDGDWISFGDGRFQPGNLLTVRYSVAQNNQVSYVPGPNDKALGFYRFMLLSDAPQGGTPQQKVSDEVTITFQSAPPLICSSNFNISLNEGCTQKVDVSMLQSNPVTPYSNYIITLYEPNGQIIAGNVLTKSHIDKEITFKLGHQCTSNTCWGKFKVEDYFPPVFVCKNDTILCNKSTLPDSLGFPIPNGAYVDTIINNKYIVKNWDACSDVALEYKDETVKANCARDEDKTITRKWKAIDAKGNIATCSELIVVKRIKLAAVVFPPHFDGIDKPAFECLDTFQMLANGNPSPDTTGRPSTGYCSNLQFNMTDVRFDLCGKSFKVARSWFVIDWCTSESVTKNQIIVVRDSRGPDLVCRDTILLEAGSYHCYAEDTEIPSLLSSADCAEYTILYDLKTSSGLSVPNFLLYTGQKSYFKGLPVGSYMLEYQVTDACNNTSYCRSQVIVEDSTEPYAVCDQTTKVALDANGKSRVFAASLDDGSTDNCGIASFKVRRMTDACGFGTTFGPYVDFCCADLNSTQMVALEVTDIHGNKNTCMVEVIVEDKIKPSITCPPNITLSCSETLDLTHLEVFGKVVTKASDIKNIYLSNQYHNGLVGKDGLATDNCSVSVSTTYTTDIVCHVGTIRRKFIATDGGGRQDSCFQTITILNPDVFNYDDITWPPHFENNGCRYEQTDPALTGNPTFTNASCATVAATYEDNKFYIADGACLKIIRTWTVVDWCQFTGASTAGKWGPYIQVIKLHNTDKPVFNETCRDTSFCSYDIQCKTGGVLLTKQATDPCTKASDLIWKYEIDVNSDGQIDTTGYTNKFEGDLPLGHHKIHWRVDDQCGNFNTCSQSFSIKDCKKPTPYCLTSLTITLMQATGQNTIWAKDFNLNSQDNCTSDEDLIYTFSDAFPVASLIHTVHYFTGNGILSSEADFLAGVAQKWIPETNSSGQFFDCGDIPNGKSAAIPLKMTVTDLQGNHDYCEVELILQDNGNNCTDLITDAIISGRISTENNKIPKGTKVQYAAIEKAGEVTIAASDGKYSIDGLPLNLDYKIKPELNSDVLEGVSTIDLVLIQRHILGLGVFDSPYKTIAADVNSSGSVSASDLVELRKLILGITDKFPKGLQSWVFVNKKDGIPDLTQPHNYINHHETGVLTANMPGIDFVAVKIGDVNQSAFNLGGGNIENRSRPFPFVLYTSIEKINGQHYYTIRSSEDTSIDGLQLFLDSTEEVQWISEDSSMDFALPDSETFLDHHLLNHIQYSAVSVQLKSGQLLHAFPIKNDSDPSKIILNPLKNSEIYMPSGARPIRLINRIGGPSPKIALLTNPVVGELKLLIPSEVGSVTYRIINSKGDDIMNGLLYPDGSLSEHTLELPAAVGPGIYFITCKSPGFVQTIKFIRVI